MHIKNMAFTTLFLSTAITEDVPVPSCILTISSFPSKAGSSKRCRLIIKFPKGPPRIQPEINPKVADAIATSIAALAPASTAIGAKAAAFP